MAKRRGKKNKDKEKIVSQPDANKKIEMKKKKKVSKVKATNPVRHAPVSVSDQGHDSGTTNSSGASSGGKRKAKEKLDRLSGFIFMCNAKTKPECFQYRVFGLPAGRNEEVEKIEAGMKLFLFDFDRKLLYGVYKATCRGQMNLESSAFGGRFPAQVSFAIHKECLPLPEGAFKPAIKDNYQGSKFNSELSGRQVKDLLSLFRPCAALTAAPVALPQVAPTQAIWHKDQLQPLVRPPPPQDPYLSGMQHGYAAPVFEPYPVQQTLLRSQHELYGTAATKYYDRPTLEQHQGLPARHPYFAEDRFHIDHDQYPRNRDLQEMVPREYYQMPLQRERGYDVQRDNVPAGYYKTYPTPASIELPVRNVPVSSYYSFAGAKQVYR